MKTESIESLANMSEISRYYEAKFISTELTYIVENEMFGEIIQKDEPSNFSYILLYLHPEQINSKFLLCCSFNYSNNHPELFTRLDQNTIIQTCLKQLEKLDFKFVYQIGSLKNNFKFLICPNVTYITNNDPLLDCIVDEYENINLSSIIIGAILDSLHSTKLIIYNTNKKVESIL